MLVEQDIKTIGKIVRDEITAAEQRITAHTDEKITAAEQRITSSVVLQVGEVIEQNILPAIDRIEKKVDAFPEILAKESASIKGSLTAKLRTEDEKVNLLISYLRKQNILTEDQWAELHALEVFPSLEREMV